MKKTALGVAAAVLVMGGAASVAMASGSTERPPAPPTPEWVNPDGTINPAKMPKDFPVMGPDGKPLKDANGKPVRVKSDLTLPLGPPPAPRADTAEERWIEKGPNGETTEHVRIKPGTPASD